MNKLIAFWLRIFPAKQSEQTVQPTTVPTLGSPIGAQPTDVPDYNQTFRDWGWIR